MTDKPRHSLYIDIAERVAQESHARRLKVGSIIVKDGRIISMGWNGMPSGWENDCEIELDDGSLQTRSEVIHAESNAIAKLAKSTESGADADLYITLSPCIDCAKLINQTGIKNVYYREDYRKNDGVRFLEKSGVSVKKV
jgi:dCMP deaminase